MRIWARLGANIEVSESMMIGLTLNPEEYIDSGKFRKDLAKAIEKGQFELDGDNYIPCEADCYPTEELGEKLLSEIIGYDGFDF